MSQRAFALVTFTVLRIVVPRRVHRPCIVSRCTDDYRYISILTTIAPSSCYPQQAAGEETDTDVGASLLMLAFDSDPSGQCIPMSRKRLRIKRALICLMMMSDC